MKAKGDELISPKNQQATIIQPPGLRLCAMLAAALGVIALFGWGTGLSLLATFGAGNIPMAPSTALFFLFFGIGAYLFTRPASNRTAHRAGTATVSLATFAVLLLFFLSWQGIHPGIEHLGMDIVGTLNSAPLGYMSPLTAFCFVLAGLSFLASLGATPAHRRRAMAAFGIASLVSLISFALLLAYFLGAPLLYGSGVIPPALSTSLAFLLLGVSLQLAAGLRAWPSDNRPEQEDPRAPYALILILAFLAVGIITAGLLFFRSQERGHRASMVVLTSSAETRTSRPPTGSAPTPTSSNRLIFRNSSTWPARSCFTGAP